MLGNFIQSKFFDEFERNKFINSLKEKYPFIRCGVLSKSFCGRDIEYIRIGKANEQALFVGGFHGMEWLTSLLLLIFCETLCISISQDKKLLGVGMRSFLEKKGLFIIPCINPDGTEISIHGGDSAKAYKNLVLDVSKGDTSRWQANARGVDLNHNFDASWKDLNKRERKAGIVGPSPTRYGGVKPESEVETQVLTNLCRKVNFRHAIAFHSQGEEIYWNYKDYTPKDSFFMANVMGKTSGYKVSEPEGLAVGGGFKDWFIKEFKRPAFTFEIGKGKNPLPIDDIVDIYKKLEKTLIFSTIM